MKADELTAKLAEITHRLERLEAGVRGPYEAPATARDRNWPGWRYGPKGEKGQFNSEAEVPEGWAKSPEGPFGKPSKGA